MTRSFVVVALIVSAFCFSSVLAARVTPNDVPTTNAAANKDDFFIVVGQIYCDPCGFQFESRLSKPLAGVKVTLECTKGDKNVTFVKESTTDETGTYNIECKGDHEEEVCKVNAVNEKGNCRKIMDNESDMIVLTKNMGVPSLVRFVNALGFMTETVDPQCGKVITELGLDKLDD
ncbi:putative pollen allergen Ole e 1 family, immunoglobulin-like protein [Medicago truncatula]|uniref:Pollen Ole e I family allergen n=1 Tax=Medicago truncatula TaxID=3880 RepID=A0A072V9W5_MEDTR|nr:pollen-specific protein-like At4g18596 [Medicago truncatula]KEH38612.1 pollen Ole e I family allergen [Medicago truncatula]RHN74971.1 putative pollen allergen Ole e 1 family, immunoglobulin-like protein [Medicago truncatula]